MECKGYYDSSGELLGRMCTGCFGENLHESLYAHCVVECENMEADGDDSDGISKLCTCEFDTRNLARMGTNLETARRILGITTRPMSTEDLVLIASADRCKRDWPCWGLHRGDRWSKNKEGCGRLRNKRRWWNIQKVFMRLSQMRDTDEMLDNRRINEPYTCVLQKTSL